jgi:Fe-S cluster assembly ATP-binding protein
MEQHPPTIKGVKLGNLANMILQIGGKDIQIVPDLSEKYEVNRFLNRDINDGFSYGEMKKTELFLLLLAQPFFIIFDEPDSGVDPEHLKTIGKMINQSLNIKDLPGELCRSMKKFSGIIATHSAAVLDYVFTDKAHIMMDGQIKCSGNSALMMNQVREYGYEYCIKCQSYSQF